MMNPLVRLAVLSVAISAAIQIVCFDQAFARGSSAIVGGGHGGIHGFNTRYNFNPRHNYNFVNRYRGHGSNRWGSAELLYPSYPAYPDVAPQPVVYVIQVPVQPELGCIKTRETVTVPSETGGPRAITVTRCGAPGPFLK